MENGPIKIHKRHIAAMAHFAINHIPHIDEATLKMFVELINITGNFNAISHEQVLKKMSLLIQLVPDTCRYSLHTLVELLDIGLPLNNAGECEGTKRTGELNCS